MSSRPDSPVMLVRLSMNKEEFYVGYMGWSGAAGRDVVGLARVTAWARMLLPQMTGHTLVFDIFCV